jgi:hypothetical protein
VAGPAKYDKDNPAGGEPSALERLDRDVLALSRVATVIWLERIHPPTAATLDPQSGTLRSEFQPSSSTGGPGDCLHPNRAGYQAMANSIDLTQFHP